jgi:hypothetical protein
MFQIFKNLDNQKLPIFIWLYIPIIFFLNIFLAKYINEDFFNQYFQQETGFIENGTFIILFFSIITCLFILKKRNLFVFKKLFLFWIIVFLFGLIYFAGEEISWGQQWFKWQTFDFFMNYNDQSETNFHNISSWYDQKPRSLLLLFIFLGGIFLPFYLKIKKKKLYSRNIKFWLFPNICCMPSALICLFFYILDNTYKFVCYGTPGIDIKCNYIPYLFVLRTSEILELFMSLFLFIYVLSIYSRLNKT